MEFFGKHADFYGNIKPQIYDYYFINFIEKKRMSNQLIDIGGGSGTFAKLVCENCPLVEVTVLDPSRVLLNKIKDNRIKSLQGKLPDDISLGSNYDFVHVKEVFHHIVASSIDESKELLKESLFKVKSLLRDDGYLLIHELFYESYWIPTFSRTLIFHLLSLQNNLRFKIPAKEFLIGLKVIFYTRAEFSSILRECGFKIHTFRKIEWNHGFKTKLLLLKNWGRMLFIAEKKIK